MFDNQIMESQSRPNIPTNQLTPLSTHRIRSEIEAYCSDSSAVHIWHDILTHIQAYITPRLQGSEEAQKSINTFLKNSSGEEALSQLVKSKKNILSSIYDLFLNSEMGNVENACIAGQTGQLLLREYGNTLKPISRKYDEWRLLCNCVESVGIYICGYIENKKADPGYTVGNRELFNCYYNKLDCCDSFQNLASKLFSNNLCLMIDCFQNIQPILFNYINLQSLLEVTSKYYTTKQCFFISLKECPRMLYNMKRMKLAELIRPQITGRQQIQETLGNLNIENPGQDQNNSISSSKDISKNQNGWNLVSLPFQFQYYIQAVISKIPKLILPKSNGDIFSYQRVKFMPTFRYNIIKPKYFQGPFLTESTLVIFNVGRLPLEVISYESMPSVSLISPLKYEQSFLKKNGIKYGKVLVTQKNLVVIPANHHYLLGSKQQRQIGFVQFICWNVLPKHHKQITNFLQASCHKHKIYKGECWGIQKCLMLFDYLNHEITLLKDQMKIPEEISNFLGKRLVEEENIAFNALKACPQTKINCHVLNEDRKYCQKCLGQIINYYAISRISKQIFCMECFQDQSSFEVISEKYRIRVIYTPQDLRYPLNIAKLFLKRKIPSPDLQNRYEVNVCPAKFIGAYETDICQGNSIKNGDISRQDQNIYQYNQAKQRYFCNTLRQYGIVPPQKQFENYALKIYKQEQQTQNAKKQLARLAHLLPNKQETKEKLFPKYSKQNLVLFAMCCIEDIPKFTP